MLTLLACSLSPCVQLTRAAGRSCGQANIWMAVISYVGNYFWTHYFYNLLGASYTFKAWRLNDVPIALIFCTHAYFCFYHTMTTVRAFRTLTPTPTYTHTHTHTPACLPRTRCCAFRARDSANRCLPRGLCVLRRATAASAPVLDVARVPADCCLGQAGVLSGAGAGHGQPHCLHGDAHYRLGTCTPWPRLVWRLGAAGACGNHAHACAMWVSPGRQFPYYVIKDRFYMYTVGSMCYGIYFIVSFPMYYR